MKITPDAHRTGPRNATMSLSITDINANEAGLLYAIAAAHGLRDLVEAISTGIDMALAAAEPLPL